VLNGRGREGLEGWRRMGGETSDGRRRTLVRGAFRYGGETFRRMWSPAPGCRWQRAGPQPKLTLGTSPSPSSISKNSRAEKPKAIARMLEGTCPILVL